VLLIIADFFHIFLSGQAYLGLHIFCVVYDT
jgi:hypothetical protein